MSYQELLDHAQTMARFIHQGFPNHQLVAVARGGVTVAHRIAYLLGKPLGFFVPAQPQTPIFLQNPVDVPPLFIEDLIAKGRTLQLLDQVSHSYPFHKDWQLMCVVKDKNAQLPTHLVNRVNTVLVPDEWIVFPYEDEDRVQVADWGLFREGTSANAKPKEDL
jgi:hypoxanthine phosphoribosyltransferase